MTRVLFLCSIFEETLNDFSFCLTLHPLPLPFHSIDRILLLTLKFISLCSIVKKMKYDGFEEQRTNPCDLVGWFIYTYAQQTPFKSYLSDILALYNFEGIYDLVKFIKVIQEA
ncbi:hypothetical protein L1987_30328 [Smallanthus sonchifolius]|uniref:Uncharacterized protein n=1 Tax=Smallanthus sonchifolius TaxID=185202 RepID=A0ACB9I3A2_9ASTR|nr:hypothetical protein L1987_30328 [Smallanthus sonchifolius]